MKPAIALLSFPFLFSPAVADDSSCEEGCWVGCGETSPVEVFVTTTAWIRIRSNQDGLPTVFGTYETRHLFYQWGLAAEGWACEPCDTPLECTLSAEIAWEIYTERPPVTFEGLTTYTRDYAAFVQASCSDCPFVPD